VKTIVCRITHELTASSLVRAGEDATGRTNGEVYLMSFAVETVGRGRDDSLKGASPPAVLGVSTDPLNKGEIVKKLRPCCTRELWPAQHDHQLLNFII
jgi:hypothetical protein